MPTAFQLLTACLVISGVLFLLFFETHATQRFLDVAGEKKTRRRLVIIKVALIILSGLFGLAGLYFGVVYIGIDVFKGLS